MSAARHDVDGRSCVGGINGLMTGRSGGDAHIPIITILPELIRQDLLIPPFTEFSPANLSPPSSTSPSPVNPTKERGKQPAGMHAVRAQPRHVRAVGVAKGRY